MLHVDLFEVENVMIGTDYPYVKVNAINEMSVKLRWYKTYGADVVGEEIIDDITLHDLQDIFDVYINSCQFNCWHVKTKHVRLLKKLITHKFSIRKYIYFIEQEGTEFN